MAGNIDNIKKNKHQKMMSNTEADPTHGGQKLILRLANLKIFSLSKFQDV
jgi:hypothetical protein